MCAHTYQALCARARSLLFSTIVPNFMAFGEQPKTLTATLYTGDGFPTAFAWLVFFVTHVPPITPQRGRICFSHHGTNMVSHAL